MDFSSTNRARLSSMLEEHGLDRPLGHSELNLKLLELFERVKALEDVNAPTRPAGVRQDG